MKKLSKIFIVLVFVAGYLTLNAQTNAKLGYINSNELFDLMPGRDTIEIQLREYKTTLENTIQEMMLEYQNKIQEYQVNVATMSDIIKQTKEKEITDLEARIQAFQQTADQDFSNKQAKLFNPLLEKAKKAIKEVAEENGYTYIFDAGVGVLLYFDKGDNVLPLVKKNLGIE